MVEADCKIMFRIGDTTPCNGDERLKGGPEHREG
jgi:hypothetical protein